jgi:DNA-binding PadR family transcriptional regulator
LGADKDNQPLTEAFYYILVALYPEPSHGYGIMQDVEKMSDGRVRIGAGTLYTALNTLLKKKWIEPAHSPEDADSRRKMYAITEAGQAVVKAEIGRLEELAANGRRALDNGRKP